MTSPSFDSSPAPDAELRVVSVSRRSDDGTWRLFGSVSLPSLEALRASRVGKLATIVDSFQRDHTLSHQLHSEFLFAMIELLTKSESLKNVEAVRGFAEVARRWDQEEFDQSEATRALATLIRHDPNSSTPLLEQALIKGTLRQRGVILAALRIATEVNERIAHACIPLLDHPSLYDAVVDLLRLGNPCLMPLAEAVTSKQVEEFGRNSITPSTRFESTGEAIITWCRAIGDFNLITRELYSGDPLSRAVAISGLSRPGAPLRAELSAVLDGLQSTSRIVVRESLKTLFTLGNDARPYAQAIHDATFADDDYTCAIGIDLLVSLSPSDPQLFQAIIERTEPYLADDYPGVASEMESDEAIEAIEVSAVLARTLVRLLEINRHDSLELLFGFFSHPSPEIRRRCCGALAIANKFTSIEKFLDVLTDDVPPIATQALLIAKRFGVEILPWLNRVERRIVRQSSHTSNSVESQNLAAVRSQVTELKRSLSETSAQAS